MLLDPSISFAPTSFNNHLGDELQSAEPTTMATSSFCSNFPPPTSSLSKFGSSKPLIIFPSNGTHNRLSSSKHSPPTSIFCSATKGPSSDNIPNNFSIIEGPETLQDFVQMQLKEIEDNIKHRRNRIFFLMEELRRLRVQQRIKGLKVIDESGEEEASEMPEIPSSIPFLPYVTPKTLKQLYLTSLSFISGIILFGGLIAPTLELKLGLGGTSYEDFIRNMHLPMQLSQVDPIVASFSGGAVGVISALMLIEANNVEQQEKKRCKYCHGSGYLACARCSSSGVCLSVDPISTSNASNGPLRVPTTQRCPNCSGDVPELPLHRNDDGKRT
ncbi:protein ORANGE-LIKE [Citrus sinensis]|nr:protein ORANGE-LIKE [Citrus sinensis]